MHEAHVPLCRFPFLIVFSSGLMFSCKYSYRAIVHKTEDRVLKGMLILAALLALSTTSQVCFVFVFLCSLILILLHIHSPTFHILADCAVHLLVNDSGIKYSRPDGTSCRGGHLWLYIPT